MAKGKRDLPREARWRGLVAGQRKSGLSVRAFCAREKVPESAFYAWRREIGLRDREKAGATPQPPAFVAGDAAGRDAEVTIEVRGGWVLHVPASLAAARITELVRAVEAAS